MRTPSQPLPGDQPLPLDLPDPPPVPSTADQIWEGMKDRAAKLRASNEDLVARLSARSRLLNPVALIQVQISALIDLVLDEQERVVYELTVAQSIHELLTEAVAEEP